jgi:hypothetical protein
MAGAITVGEVITMAGAEATITVIAVGETSLTSMLIIPKKAASVGGLFHFS